MSDLFKKNSIKNYSNEELEDYKKKRDEERTQNQQ